MPVPDNTPNRPAADDHEFDAELQDAPEVGERASGPAAVPPNHLHLGAQNEFADDPVVGSVMADDWGPIPGAEADLEEGETWVFHDDAVI